MIPHYKYFEKRVWRCGQPEKTPNPFWTIPMRILMGYSIPKSKHGTVASFLCRLQDAKGHWRGYLQNPSKRCKKSSRSLKVFNAIKGLLRQRTLNQPSQVNRVSKSLFLTVLPANQPRPFSRDFGLQEKNPGWFVNQIKKNAKRWVWKERGQEMGLGDLNKHSI